MSVKVKVTNSGGLTTYAFGRGDNLSEGGLAAHLAHHLEVGSTVRISLTLPHAAKPIECDAVVRNKESFSYGLEFKGLSTEDVEVIRKTCHVLEALRSI